MRIKFEFCTKMVFCLSHIVNCAKSDAPIKGPKHVFNLHDIPVEMRMRNVFLLTGCCLDDKQGPIYLQVYAFTKKFCLR